MLELVETCDADFDWMAGGPSSRSGLALPPGGVDTPEGVAVVRTIHAANNEAGTPGAWMMVAGGEVVGLCGAVRPPRDRGEIEIGYGVAPQRRRRGHAGEAVGLLLAMARADPSLTAVTAVTTEENAPSQAVLRRHGFAEVGREVRDEDGPVILWRLSIAR
jgi:RimJ/RimL family protein N-acetyltransferase